MRIPLAMWRPQRWMGPALSVVAFAILLVWSWGKWPDVLIDFGRELYVPWQLSEGKLLYADIAYFNGPLSPTINALLFRLFGTSLRTLVLANAAILILIAIMIHVLLRILCDRFTATAGTLAFLVFFAFEFMPEGSYNFIAPYSHEMTHGTALATGALLLLAIHFRGGGNRVVFAMGCSLGLTFLTKTEFVIALFPALVTGLMLHHVLRGTSRHEALAVSTSFAAGALMPPVLALLLLLTALTPGQALKAVVGSWAYVFNNDLWELRFYREILGTLDFRESLGRIGVWTLRYAAVIIPAGVAGVVLRRSWRASQVLVGLLAPAAAAMVLVGRQERDWYNLARPFPLVLVVGLVVVSVGLLGGSGSEERRSRQVLTLACLIYALALLLKMFFNVRILHYGFALAMPAGIAVVAILLGGVPEWLERRGKHGMAFRTTVLGAIIAFAFVHLAATDLWLRRRTVAVGRNGDTFLAAHRDRAFVDLVARIEQMRRPKDTLAVIPEGVMLNYLTRMENPTPYISFMPPEIFIFTEDRMLAAFQSRPPYWIVLVNRSAAEYGFLFIGYDYGRKLLSWVEASYEVADRVFEADVWGHRQPFAAILRRRSAATGEGAAQSRPRPIRQTPAVLGVGP